MEPIDAPTPEAMRHKILAMLRYRHGCSDAELDAYISTCLDAFAQEAVGRERGRACQIVLHEAKRWPATDQVQDPFVNIYKRIRSGEQP